MVGVGATAAGDAVTHAEFMYAISNGNYFASAAVSQSRQGIQLCVHLLVGGFHSILSCVLDNLLDEIGTCFRLGEERLRA